MLASHQFYDNPATYEVLHSPEHLFAAWEQFRRGKRVRSDVMAYAHDLEANLFELAETLRAGSYRHGTYKPFIIHDPKQRRIHKATVRDRVVHQALVSLIEASFDRRFIFDSYSCRRTKGTHAAVQRLQTLLNRTSRNDRVTVHALKCDVHRFFDSIDHRILLDHIGRSVKDPRLRGLCKSILESFSTAPGKGMPLGNLTSQLFANIYLNELDRFVKHELCEPYYLRYCDDFILLGRSRSHLQSLIPRLETFLRHALTLDLHPSKVSLRTWNQGIDWLGYVLLPRATVIRSKTRRRMLRQASPDNLSSYLGLCGHADTFELQQLLRTKAGYDT